MRSAPPVVYPVGRFVWRRPAAFGLLVLLSVWIWQPWQAERPRDGLLLWGSVALQCLLLWRLGWLIRSPIREIRHVQWDGEHWHCETASGQWLPAFLEVHADLQRCLWMVVNVGSSSGSEGAQRFWICARASAKPGAWHGFRCAVYFRSQGSDPRASMTEAEAAERRRSA